LKNSDTGRARALPLEQRDGRAFDVRQENGGKQSACSKTAPPVRSCQREDG